MKEIERHHSLPQLDWSEVPVVGDFFGRTAELTRLQQWLVDDRCRVVTILGMGGLGKTSLAAQAAHAVANEFQFVIWRSLLNAPTLDELLPGILQTLSNSPDTNYPDSLSEKLALLLHWLHQRRCLMVLDNLETILHNDPDPTRQYRSGYEEYGRLIETLAQHQHQSCLLLTSREQPQSRWLMGANLSDIQTLALSGLNLEANQQILQARGITITDTQAHTLTVRYSGNPLALNLLAQTIQDLYFGDVEAFLTEETLIFADIRDVLDKQFNRLSPLEQDTLLWLAVARQPMFPPDLTEALVHPVRQRELLETLRSLRQRSLLERSEAGFMLQNVVTEYLTDLLIEQVDQELESGVLNRLNSHALLQAQAKTYVRLSEARLILQPIAERLAARLGLTGVDRVCRQLLDHLRRLMLAPGYAAGNILNLLLYLGIDVTGYDFSRLSVQQADLRGHLLPAVNFSGADLRRSVFTDIFGILTAVTFSPDGQYLAAGGSDGKVWVWKADTYQPVAMLTGHTEMVSSFAFSPDGKTLASAGTDGVIRLWEVETGRVRHTLKGTDIEVQVVAFSSDGQTLAATGRDYVIHVWDLADTEALAAGQPRQILQGHTDLIESAAFSPNGQILASAGRDHTVRLWDAGSGQLLVTLSDHSNWVNAVAFSPNGEMLVSAGEDGTICTWDIPAALLVAPGSPKPRKAISGHNSGIQSVAFAPDGKTLASGSNDHTVRLWDVASGQSTHILRGHTNWVRAVAFSPDGQTLASGSWDHTVRLWEVKPHRGQPLRTLRGYTNMVFCMASSPNGKTLASAHSDNTIRLWEIADGQLRHTLQGHSNWVWSVAFSPDGKTLASSSFDSTVRLWDIATGQLRHKLEGHNGAVQGVAFGPDGLTLASSSVDHTICLWDANSGGLKHRLKKHTNWSLSVAFSPDGHILASSSADQSIILWDAASGKIRCILEGHSRGVQNITFSPDGMLLASISWDKTVRLWEVATGQSRHILRDHTDLGQAVAFSPDGQTLASSSYDQTVRLWDVATGQLIRVLEGHTNWVFYVTFTPNGQIVASSSADETIKLWDPLTGKCLQSWQPPGPYEGMNISGATGITEAQRSALKVLGAIE
jgi:WD40 repeat protein